MRQYLNVVALFVAMVTLLVVGQPLAGAATQTAATNGYRLSPVRTDLSITPGSSEDVTVSLQNVSSAVENLQVVINDFEAPTNESGDPALLLNGATAPAHSLKQFVSVPTPTFTLQPNQQQNVKVVIKVPVGTASGGYYGAIRFAPIGAPGSKNVNLSASIASLVLVTVPGNLNEQLSIAGFGITQGNSTSPSSLFFNNKNLQAQVRFQNGGNVQEQPFGNVVLKRGSKTLSTVAVNSSSSPGNVLPDSIRRFTVKINKVGWYGKYKAVGNFGYGSKGQLLTATATFYVVPVLFIIIAVILLLIVLFFVLVLPRLMKRYKRRIIAQARQQHQ